MRKYSYSMPSSPKLNAELYLVAFAIVSAFVYLFQGYNWVEAFLAGTVTASVYVGARILIAYALKRSGERRKSMGSEEEPKDNI